MTKELNALEATRKGIDFIDIKGDRRGYCYCCGRVGFKLNKAGQMSRHGFTRNSWYPSGECRGSYRTPEETLEIAIAFLGREISELKAVLATDLVREYLSHRRRELGGEARGSSARLRVARDIREIREGKVQNLANFRWSLENLLKTSVRQLETLMEVKNAPKVEVNAEEVAERQAKAAKRQAEADAKTCKGSGTKSDRPNMLRSFCPECGKSVSVVRSSGKFRRHAA